MRHEAAVVPGVHQEAAPGRPRLPGLREGRQGLRKLVQRQLQRGQGGLSAEVPLPGQLQEHLRAGGEGGSTFSNLTVQKLNSLKSSFRTMNLQKKFPVCGKDGRVYASRCLAGCAGVEPACDGLCPCPPGGAAGDDGTCRTFCRSLRKHRVCTCRGR